MLKKTLLALVVILAAVSLLATIYDYATMARYIGDSTEHFNGSHFVSPGTVKKPFSDVLKWGLNRQQGAWENRPVETVAPRATNADNTLEITFVNHSTVLIQVAGLNLLTDPNWSAAAGPMGRIGPKRYRLPGVEFSKLPKIDAVLVSHSHYDHMDLPTLSKLHVRDQPEFIAGLGNEGNFAKGGIDKSTTLAWWQRHRLSDRVEVIATPAAHWSRRTLLDTNRTHWASYVILVDGNAHVFFAGDTGYGPHFKEIFKTIGAPRIALMPIGAYLPQWFMAGSHISPAEALKSTEDLQASTMIPIHFGTFALADDGQDEPLTDLLHAQAKHTDFELVVLDNGQHATFSLQSTID